MYKYFLIVPLIIHSGFTKRIYAQNLDSLWAIWSNPAQPDTSRLNAIYDFTWDGYLYSKPDSAFYYAQLQYDFAQSKGLKKHMANALNLQGESWLNLGDYPKALAFKLRLLRFNEELGNKKFLANNLTSIGNIYAQQGDYPYALDYYLRSLKVWEEIGDKNGIAGVLNNVGIIYGRQGDNPQALDYYQRSLQIREEIGEKRYIAGTLINMGFIYDKQGETAKALDHFQRGLKICEEIEEKRFMANALSGIGAIYASQGEYTQGLDYFQRSLQIYEEIGAKSGYPSIMINIGNLYIEKKEYKTAIDWCKKGFNVAEEIGSINRQKESCECLYDAYRALGKYNEALGYHEKMMVFEDSLQSEETTKKLQQMEFAKVMLQDSIAKAEEAQQVQVAHQEEVRKKDRTRNAFIVSSLFLLLLAGGLYSRWRYMRKSRDIITKERDRSENLLLNILPAEIAAELKEKGRADARDFDMVSILFTDFKGFTEASAKLSAQELVSEINACFQAFDTIMTKFGIEKIKTIGDAYMAAGGLPIPTDDSVKNTVLAALEMQDFIQKRKAENIAAGKPAFEMRVGIHTGPVVAGIVGVKKFQYDIWGDTVNTASRMESSGEVGRVNISQSTYELLNADSGFVFEPRGKVEAKGKGEMEMYFVRLSAGNASN